VLEKMSHEWRKICCKSGLLECISETTAGSFAYPSEVFKQPLYRGKITGKIKHWVTVCPSNGYKTPVF
jgi:hypothetical protein